MNNKISILVLFLATIIRGYALDLSFEEVLSLKLPVVEITTIDFEEPTCEYVTHPEGSMGEGITNATKVPGSVTVFAPDGSTIYSSGEYEKGESGMTVKIRGNTSAYTNKKPYKIKLQKKGDLLGRGDKNFNDKNWVLLKDNELKLWIGFEISRLLEEKWTPSGMYVNVIMNGDYRGLYYLCESIERNEKSRINVSECGFIVEHDAYWWNEGGQYLPSKFNPSFNFTFKYPDYEDLTGENLESISLILNQYEESITEETYEKTIDLDSFAKWILGHDILGSWDSGGANFYLSKYDESTSSLIEAGPLWDFDCIEMMEGKWSNLHNGFKRFNGFYSSGNTPFMRTFRKLWENKKDAVVEGVYALIEDLNDEEKWEGYNLSSIANAQRWYSAVNSASKAASREGEWFASRFEWLQEQFDGFEPLEEDQEDNKDGEETGINNPNINPDYKFQTTPTGIIPDRSGIPVKIYTIDGKLIRHTITKQNEEISIGNRGLYLIHYGDRVIKIII